uniref:N-acetyltransferase domain-containing protein n=1 Tax=Lygus hesperus TaxID=30085 RepID=A0A0K8SN63_LYGHE
MIGDANLYLNVSGDDEVEQLTGEIGLMVAEPQFRGRGLGKEIALCLMRYGIESIGIQRFRAVISMKNEISIKMFEKLDFAKESESEVFKEVTLTRTVDDNFIRFVRCSSSVYQECSTRPNE